MTVIPIAQYLVQFDKNEPRAAEPLGGESLHMQSFDPRAEEEFARKLEDAQANAREEGRAAAAAELEAELARERDEIETRIAAEREAWLAEEGRRLGEAVESAFQGLETRIADSVARILQPFLEAALRQQVVSELSETLSALFGAEPPLLKASGPESLLDALKEKLGASRSSIEYLPGEGTDITVAADHTIVETRLKAWIDRFQQAIEG